jgi:class 3 adenylate cyclase
MFETKLTAREGIVFIAVGFVFTSMLALLGSLLWGFLPYWPLFMLTNLAALYVGWWGVLLAGLAPVTTALFQDPMSLVYTPVNFLQVTLFLGGMQALRIDKSARSLVDKIKLVAVSAASSAAGATFAWTLRHWLRLPEAESLATYNFNWVVENVIPVVVPGLWLHKVMAETTEASMETPNKQPPSLARRTLDYVLPWVGILLVIGAMLVITVAGGIESLSISDLWNSMIARASSMPALRVSALVLLVAMLYSVGSAMRHAKQHWRLVEAVRRHLPSRRLSELLTAGVALPTENRLVTVVFTDLRGFTETSAKMQPDVLVQWLNAYFTRMGAVVERYGGAIDKYIGDGIMIVFGLSSAGAQTRSAVLCALDMLVEIREWQKQSAARGLPEVGMGVGIHAGIVTAGEIGSPDRRQYTVIGSVVNTSARLESASKGVPADALPIVISHEAMQHADLTSHPQRDEIVAQMPVALKGVADVDTAWCVRADAVGDLRVILSGAMTMIAIPAKREDA